MAKRWNSGQGGVTCDECNVLVVAGYDEKLHWIYGKNPFYICEEVNVYGGTKEEFHFCSRKCMQKYEKKYNLVLRIACVVSPAEEVNEEENEKA